ncbi:MAG: ABC transporter substrate-binding protein [Desulforegulaceae bacterium]|nr:ABC transporter substrate-binding protein [Desulforegulaceae bacterium]
MRNNLFKKTLLVLFPLILSFSITPKIFAETIKIGQSLPLTGEMEKSAQEFQKGSLSWINYINSRGGINGKQIELITKDDKGNSETALKITENFILDDILVLYGYLGYDSAMKSYELSKKNKLAFFGAATGSTELHEFSEPNAFFTRPDYGRETASMVDLLIENKKNKISFFYSDSNWAESFYKGAKWSFEEKNLKIFSSASVQTKNPDFKFAAKKINSGFPDAVIIASEAEIAALFIKELRKLNPSIIIMAASEVDGSKLSGLLMNQGIGVIVSQVVPFPFQTRYQITNLYKRLSSRFYPEETASFKGFEGFISARALTTILSDCEEPITREGFIKKAHEMPSVNLGGFVFDFKENKATGSVKTYFTQIGPGGFLSPIISLKDVYKYSPL